MALRYPEDIAVRAFHATGNIPSLAGIVMEELLHGKGVPRDMAGVWTTNDDKVLDHTVSHGMASERSRRRIMLKHGEERVVAREAFLDKKQAQKTKTRR